MAVIPVLFDAGAFGLRSFTATDFFAAFRDFVAFRAFGAFAFFVVLAMCPPDVHASTNDRSAFMLAATAILAQLLGSACSYRARRARPLRRP